MKMQAHSRQDGFSIVEILVATMILTFGLLAMAASNAYVATHLKSTTYTTQRTQAKERMVEQLRAMPYANVTTTSTAQSVGRYSMTWNVTTANTAKRVALITSGPGYLGRSNGARVTVVDTMNFVILSPL